MKFIHLSDLHIGKRVNEFPMLEDQQYIFTKIFEIINNESPDAVIIAGDIYDRSLPPNEAVSEFDDFIFKLSQENFQTFIISGNHDSPERIAFGSRIMANSGIHLSPVYNGVVKPFTMKDDFGEIDIYMLPFIKPFNVKNVFPEQKDEINSYTDAVRVAVEHMNVDINKRNIIVSHQFVTGAARSDSEVSVGSTDNVDYDVYNPFDYVALGHIHSPQKIAGFEHIRYCGTPLKYSFSEKTDKSVTVVEMLEKGNLNIKEVTLVPKRDMRTIKGTFEYLYNDSFKTSDYIHAVLTDDYEIPNAMSRLREVYENIMSFEYSQDKSVNQNVSVNTVDVERKTPLELFGDFFEMKSGREMNDEEIAYMESIIREVEEEENATD